MRPALIVAALGYFVDIFDIWLYSVYRVASLTDLGYSGEEMTAVTTHILNAQMLGMLLGGLLFGVMGDKVGRKSSLFGSILIYATATLANAFVWDAESYAVARFAAGFGLAGELGAGVTLTMESMSKQKRGMAPTVIAGFGLFGCVAASLVADFLPWRHGYVLGGCLGFLLFLLRLKVVESSIYKASRQSQARHGSLLDLVNKPTRFWRYILCILIGTPVWYVSGILLLFAPEMGRQLGVQGPVIAAHAILCFSVALAFGDIACGLLSQKLQSRRWALLAFMLPLSLMILVYFSLRGLELRAFYALYILMGFFAGFWAVMMATVTEQFGTNLRATAATTVPNFIRGSVVLMTTSLDYLLKPSLGVLHGSAVLGFIVMSLAITASYLLPESFHKDMDVTER